MKAICTLKVTLVFVLSNHVALAEPVKADVSSLCETVTKLQSLNVRYDDDPLGSPPRIISPHGVGYTKKKDILLLAYQVSGYSKSGGGEGEGWRNFRVDKIRALDTSDAPFKPSVPKKSEFRYLEEFVCKSGF